MRAMTREMFLHRLLAHISAVEENILQAKDIISDALEHYPAKARPPYPDMILQCLRTHPKGMSRADMIASIKITYDFDANPQSMTVTLNRLKRAGRIHQRGRRLWLLSL
jgi:hypothetical protein